MVSPENPITPNEQDRLTQAVAALDARRSMLGNEAVIEIALASIHEKLESLKAGGKRYEKVRQERKLVTLLFADVSGFTAMSETMDHEVVNDVINSLWTRVDRAIIEPGGRIDKHIGDAIMAIYGTPVARADDPERAVRSALRIQSEIQDWKREQSDLLPNYKNQIQNIQLRIGINTGIALLGTVGTVGEFTAIGDNVILANKLESAAPRGGILISHDTYQHVKDTFEVTALEPITVKGRAESIQVYTINGLSKHASQDIPKGRDDSEAPVIHVKRNIDQAIGWFETNRSVLGDDVVDTVLVSLREKLAEVSGERRTERIPQQRKLVTVLFADVSGFNVMFENMDHELVSDVMDSLWSRVDKAIQEHGGRIDKHIVDVVMALYGIPTAHEDDPERAIRSALQIQSEIQEWKREQSALLPDYKDQIQNIQLRIGVNTGPALLGTVGTVGEFTAIGDTVNLAQRLEANAPKGEVQISSATYQHVRGIFDVTALEPITVKGKSEPIQVYTVQSVKPRSFRDTTRGLEGVETRTIGREAELKQMQDAFNEVASRQITHLVTLVADAGLGKSRLLFEFGKWVDAHERPARIFRGRAAQETTKIPYALLRGILSSAFEIQENDRASIARQKLERGIHQLVNNKELADVCAPFIGHLIGFDYSEHPKLRGILGDARQVRDLAFHFGAQFFADIAQQKSVVIFLEDIHWSDTGSLEFFENLMKEAPNLSIMILALTRASLFEQKPDWGTGPVRNLSLNLAPLSDSDTRLLICEILKKVPEIPEVIIDLIVKKAEGSPFYVEELIKVLIEGGVIVRGAEQWSVEMDRLSDLKVPTTLTGLLQARLDSLKPDARETLQQASVVGRVFWMDIIQGMQNPEENYATASPITDRLGVLRAKELIYRYEESASAKASEFIFKNQILHDVTYESVLLRLRPVYHAQAAQGLVNIGGERANEYAGRVGEHFESAGEWFKAAEWYARAGKQAQNTFASDAAINYYQKALDFLKSHDGPETFQQKFDIYLQLAEVISWQARYSDAIDTCNEGLKFAEEHGDLNAQARALYVRAMAYMSQGDNRALLESAIESEKIAREANERVQIAKALWAQGIARVRLGEAHVAQALAEESLAICTELDQQNEIARCLNLLGAITYFSGNFDQTQIHWENALKVFQERGNRQQGMVLLNNLGVIADARGDYETALNRYDSALAIAQEIGDKDQEIIFLSNRGGEKVALKNYEAAELDLRKAIQLAGFTGSSSLPASFNYRAEALLGLGRLDEAFYSARQALVLAEEDKTPEVIGVAWRTLGMISARQGDAVRFSDWETHQKAEHDAQNCFDKSVKILLEAEIDMERARTLREWARYEFKRGNRVEGEKMWQEAKEIFAKLGAQLEVERMGELPG